MQKLAQDTLVSLPGWQRFEEVTHTLTSPVRSLASGTQRVLPFTRRLDWLLEIERLKSLHPVILAISLAFAIRRGLYTTQYGHIGTDTLIYPTLAAISVFNPFLGVVSAIAFGIGHIVQKLFINDIYGTNGVGRELLRRSPWLLSGIFGADVRWTAARNVGASLSVAGTQNPQSDFFTVRSCTS